MIGQKILCIGNETESTDIAVSALAEKNDAINHGLISNSTFYPKEFGYYHTSIADIPAGGIVTNLVQHFDLIMMVDQHIDSYPHWKSFVNTFCFFSLANAQTLTVLLQFNNACLTSLSFIK